MNIDTNNQRKIHAIAKKLGWDYNEALNWIIDMGCQCANTAISANKTENRADKETPHQNQH